MQEKELINPEELQSPKLATIPALGQEEKIMEGVEDVVEITEEDLDKKSYVKITPTFYVKSVKPEIGEEPKLDDEGNPIELFKILNPETQEVETRELTDEEKKEILIQQLKESRMRFNPIKHNGNVTTNQFGAAYRKKRQMRNKLAKKARQKNR